MTVPLRMTVDLMPGETATSLVSRLAARNGIPFAEAFCQDYRLIFNEVVNGEPAAIYRLADLTGVDPDRLYASSFRRIEQRGIYLGSERFKARWISRTQLRVCPACLLQDASNSTLPPDAAMYGRNAWQVSFVRTCHLHSQPLITLASPRKSVHDFASSVRLHARQLPRLTTSSEMVEVTKLESYMIRRIAGEIGGVPLLDDIPAGMAARFCEVSGTVRLYGRTTKPSKLDEAQIRAAGEVGFDLAKAGEDAIRAFVHDMVRGDIAPRAANGGPQAVLGTLSTWLSDNRQTQEQEGLRALILDAIAASLPIGTNAPCLGGTIKERRLHSIRSASLETGVHPQRLRKLLIEGGLIGNDHAGKPDNLVTFAADTSAAFLDRLRVSMGLGKVADYACAPRVQAQLLYRAGYLKTMHPRSASSKQLLAFDPAQVDYLLASLMNGAVNLDVEVKGAFSIPRAAKRVPCGAMDIVRIILERKLPWIGKLSSLGGYVSIRVKPDEVRAVLFPGIGITVRQAAARLELPVGITQKLLNEGLLRTCNRLDASQDQEIYIVDPISVEEFHTTFAGLRELVPEWGFTPRLARSNLQNCGIHPIFSAYDVVRSFYLRTSVENAS